MCGRFSHKLKWKDIKRLAGLTTTKEAQLTLRYNVAPSQTSSVIRDLGGERRLDQMRWGLVPKWASDSQTGQTIARAETVASKPTFRDAFRHRRCVIPVSGFYEWKKIEGESRKQPYHIQFANDEPMFLAGVWEEGPPAEGGAAVDTFAMITTAPNEMMAQIHDRMPVILDAKDLAAWLSPDTDAKTLASLLKPFPAAEMVAHLVSTRVNSPRNDDQRCVDPIAPPPSSPGLFDPQ